MATRERIMVLEGRELDRGVARTKGWQRTVRDIEGRPAWQLPSGMSRALPHFHDDIAAAWELVEEMDTPHVWQLADGLWSVSSQDEKVWLGMHERAPTAIARAYLLAKMEA